MKLGPIDVGIISAYFVAVLAVGYYLKDRMRTSSDFLLTNHSLSHWITGIAFVSANPGSLEVMGHIAKWGEIWDAHQSLVLDRGNSSHGFSGYFYGALLLRERSTQRSGVFTDAFRSPR
jgi:hypothetical protein